MPTFLILVALCGFIGISGHQVHAGETVVTSVPVPEKTALALAPECERALRMQADGVWYSVGVLHHRWAIAVAAYRVRGPEKNYLLRIAFNPAGELAGLAAEPPEALPEDLDADCGAAGSAGCEGMDAMSPEPAHDPRAVLRQAVKKFHRSLQTGNFERALQRRLRAVDTVTGATP